MSGHQGCKSQAWQIGNFKWVINKVQIFIKKSLKNRDRNKIEHDWTCPRFQLGRVGPGRYGSRFLRAGPDSSAQSGPSIYNSGGHSV